MAQPIPLTSGPWPGVNNAATSEDTSYLYDAQNCYFPKGASYLAQRPAWQVTQAGGVLGTVSSRFGGVLHEHIGLDGTVYRFVIAGGHVYRWDGATTFTDVSPVGITIAPGGVVYACSFADQVVVNDQSNRPWRLTNPSATPVTGTYIDYDGAGTAWAAQGKPVVYGAKLFFILKTVNSVARQNEIAWSEEASPSTGYQQTNFDNNWQLTQTASDAIYALCATNLALYYFREKSIGVITGAVNADFATSSTHDAIDEGIGCTQPGSVVLAKEKIWFVDRVGRPYMIPLGGKPAPIWAAATDAITSSEQLGLVGAKIAQGIGVFGTDLDVVLLGSYRSSRSVIVSDTLFAFDAETTQYLGRWTVDGATAPFIHVLGEMRNSNGAISVMALGDTGSSPAVATSGTVFRLYTIGEETWTNGTNAPVISATVKLAITKGFQEYNFGDPVAITASAAPCTLTYTVPRGAVALSAAIPVASADGSYRVQWGTNNCVGRSARFQIAPTTFTAQWALHALATIARPAGTYAGMP